MACAGDATKPLTAMSEKRSPRERKRRDNQDAITGSQASMLALPSVSAKANQSGLLEAVWQRENERPAFLVSQCTPNFNPGSGAGLGRSNAAGENQSPGLGSDQSYRQIAYNEYLAQAFGLSGEDQGKIAEQQVDSTGADAFSSTPSELSATFMELSFRLSLRERRPKIQLTIPRTKSKTYAPIPHEDMKGQPRGPGQDPSKGVSPPSTTSHRRTDPEGAAARLSVVSPLSIVEMPKPRRPFSTFSFEELTDELPNSEPILSKSASSDSSDDTGEHDGKSSSYSRHSSISSLASDPAAVKPVAVNGPSLALSVASPIAASLIDPKFSATRLPSHPRVTKSMTSLSGVANRNKPLPPAPGQDAVKPLNYSTHSFARTNSMKADRTTPGPRCASRQSTISISSHKSLRSRYTLTDPDAGHNIPKRSSPKNVELPRQFLLGSPTLSQAELELEAHLCAIEEDFPLNSQEARPVHHPLQIGRGPMRMEPSRITPSPPSPQVFVESPLTYGKMHTKKSVTHVAMQMRPGKELIKIPHKRVSAPVVGLNDKAHRVLGRSCKATATGREASAQSRWTSSESPHSSPNLSMENPDTPEGERSPLISDADFEEVRQRLELLSPKSDVLQDFLEYHEKNLSSAGVTPPRQEASTRKASNDTTSIHPSSRLIETCEREQRRAGPGQIQSVPRSPRKVNRTPRERHTPLSEPRTRHDPSSPHPYSSIATFKIPPICAPLPSLRLAEEEAERMISPATAEKVLLCVLENLGNLQDLFATATVSRGFYRTFKRHELPLIKDTLYTMSPAAWELREMSPPFTRAEGTSTSSMGGYTPQLYLQDYRRDMYTMIALKHRILVQCESFLRAETITALAGGETERASQIDDAFWRVWTFCRLFGCGTRKEDDIVYQMDWLRGGVLAREQRRSMRTLDHSCGSDSQDLPFGSFLAFGRGNCGGLSAEELYDMTEIWNCLRVLVGGFQGKRELAREFSIFENADIPVGDIEGEDAALGTALFFIHANTANTAQKNGHITFLLLPHRRSSM